MKKTLKCLAQIQILSVHYGLKDGIIKMCVSAEYIYTLTYADVQ